MRNAPPLKDDTADKKLALISGSDKSHQTDQMDLKHLLKCFFFFFLNNCSNNFSLGFSSVFWKAGSFMSDG